MARELFSYGGGGGGGHLLHRSLYCFTTPICHGVENYFPRLWGVGISGAILRYIL